MSRYDYDLFVIGAGSGGVRAARISAGFGARVGICEDTRLGGTCVMRGCVPKKLLVYGSHFHQDIEDARAYGWRVDPATATVDWGHMIDRKDAELNRLEGVYHTLLADAGVTLIDGRGVPVDAHTVNVGGRTVTAENILIATGGRPSMPDIPGIEHAITSNEALDLRDLPDRMVIVGGGYIAVEFAGIFTGTGVAVTEIIRGPNILRGFDDDIRDHLRHEMTGAGVTILSETTVESIEKTPGGYSLKLGDGRLQETDLVMYATGRAPNTAGLGLESLGVDLDDAAAVIVNERYQTSVPGIYAIGDVTNRVNLTPVAIAEGMIVANALFNGTFRPMDYDNIPTAVFSQPPVGTVGLTEEQARERGDTDVYISRFRSMKHTISGRDGQALMKLVVHRESDRVVGLHMVGPDSPEIAQGFGVAMKAGATKAQFDGTVGIHPTAAEELVTMREKTR